MKQGLNIIILMVVLLISGGGLTRLNAQQKEDCRHQMLLYLQAEQADGSGYFPKGLFPSYRQYVYHPDTLKDDDNCFFTALVVFTLNEIYPKLSKKDQKIVQEIRAKAQPALALFKNRQGRGTYNFWRTHPQMIFPNGGWLNWFDKPQSLPDDFDDTSMGLMALQADTPTIKALHKYMQDFTNRPEKRIKSTLPPFRQLPAYSVWFGENFPIDFDVCVLCNVLYLVSAYQLPWSSADSASLKFIKTAISDSFIFTRSAFIAPHYHTTPIILYHIARLISINPGLLNPYRKRLRTAALKAYQDSDNPVEKAMLTTALHRLGNTSITFTNHAISCSKFIRQIAPSGFVFFIANMASILPNPLKSPISKWGIGQFNYYCPAYNVALTLEAMIVSQQ